MITTLEETRRLDAWEPLGRQRDGHGQFGVPILGGARGMSTELVTKPSKASESEPGLTRRGVIYEYVRSHPGNHIRGTARALGIATGDLQYHLSWLERRGFVKTRKGGFFRFVFPTMLFSEEQEALLAVLSQKTPREILLCLIEEASLTQGDLANRLGYSQPTISWHMARLVRLGMLRKSRTFRGTLHEVIADRDDVLAFVRSYHPGVWRRWAGRLGGQEASAGTGMTENGRALEGARQTLMQWSK